MILLKPQEAILLLVISRNMLLANATISNFQIDVSEVHLNFTALVGRNITLKCPTTNEEGHRVAWIKFESRTILSLHGELVTQSKRYAIINKEEGTFDLQITKVKESDEGTYICQINSNPMKNMVIILSVRKSPRIISSRSLQNDHVTAKQGEKVRLECRAEGNPVPTIHWQTQNAAKTSISQVGNILVLDNVTWQDTGTYMCIANNGYPPSVSHTYHLRIKHKPIISFRILDERATHYQIVCNIRSFPLPFNYGIKNRDLLLTSTPRPSNKSHHRLFLTNKSQPGESNSFSDYNDNNDHQKKDSDYFGRKEQSVYSSTRTKIKNEYTNNYQLFDEEDYTAESGSAVSSISNMFFELHSVVFWGSVILLLMRNIC